MYFFSYISYVVYNYTYNNTIIEWDWSFKILVYVNVIVKSKTLISVFECWYTQYDHKLGCEKICNIYNRL